MYLFIAQGDNDMTDIIMLALRIIDKILDFINIKRKKYIYIKEEDLKIDCFDFIEQRRMMILVLIRLISIMKLTVAITWQARYWKQDVILIPIRRMNLR